MERKITESVLFDYFNGDLSTSEAQAVREWRDMSDSNLREFENVGKAYLLMRWGMRSSFIDGNYDAIAHRIGQEKKKDFQRSRFIKKSLIGIVSVAVIALFLFFDFPIQWSKTVKNNILQEIPPHAAILRLSDGTQHFISSEGAEMTEQDGTLLAVNEGELTYENNKGAEYDHSTPQHEAPLYNEISVPRGAGHYKVVLSDGSMVWLNSDSHIKYPISFSKDERRVTIVGEAYFDIAREEERPFIVETPLQTIQVLGTQFNVSAYPSEATATTLVYGAVKVTPSDREINSVVLSPGEQAVLDTFSDNISVNKISVNDVISWKDGFIGIENMSLSKILKIISRTYDVDFLTEEIDADNIILRGSIPNNEKLEVVLSVLSKVTDVKFKIEANGKISVRENENE